MFLKTVHLDNFRCFEQASFSFHPRLTLIAGKPYSGKTALLEAAALSVGVFLNNLDKAHGIPLSAVRISPVSDKQSLQPERIFPCSITSLGNICGTPVHWSISLHLKPGSENRTVRTRYGQAKEMVALSRHFNQRLQEFDPTVCLPLIAFYGCDRTGTLREFRPDDHFRIANRRNGYIQALHAGTDEKAIKRWLLKCLLKEWQNKQPLPEFRAIQSALLHAYSVLNSSNAIDLAFNLKAGLLDITSMKNGEPVIETSDQWSSDCASLLFLIAEIACRMANLNPGLGEKVLQRTEGICFIDEIEQDLDPVSCRKIVPLLLKTFPGIQFVITTNSPAIIESVEPEHRLFLDC